ncbi:MAG: hypothetical protein JSS35_14935 [Proteobacteria bacterium]|nr:hypothetical protein [Pseudomonadota bacterium]
MTTLTEIVASVVVHSSAVALSHFGVTMQPTQIEKAAPPAERVIARTHASAALQPKVLKLTSCRQPAPKARPISA